MTLLELIMKAKLLLTHAEAIRLISNGGVRINNQVINDKDYIVNDGTFFIQLGKRVFKKVVVKNGEIVE